MQKAAAKEGLNIYISSGYRSYNRQVTLYNNYVKSDGVALADTYSSRPGHSEHQTGLCFDLNTIDDSFGNTAESAWLEKHAQEYGFIIRFPKGKESYTGYQYEPWHLRYVGVELATKIYESGLSLEEYLGITSEYAD
jgi:D-alanyl-D-alanine carboxypeptidase